MKVLNKIEIREGKGMKGFENKDGNVYVEVVLGASVWAHSSHGD